MFPRSMNCLSISDLAFFFSLPIYYLNRPRARIFHAFSLEKHNKISPLLCCLFEQAFATQLLTSAVKTTVPNLHESIMHRLYHNKFYLAIHLNQCLLYLLMHSFWIHHRTQCHYRAHQRQ